MSIESSFSLLLRCILGLSLIPVHSYVCEISPTNKRGPLATMVQLFITMGLMVGFFSCYGTVRIPSSLSWRLPLALQSAIALVLTVAAGFFLPQSPRWLAQKGRREEASIAWDKLGVSNAEREKDLLQAPASTVEAGSTTSARHTAALKTGFRDRAQASLAALTSVFGTGARKPMLLGVFLMSMQQLSGIDGVIYVRLFSTMCLHLKPLIHPSMHLSSFKRPVYHPPKRPFWHLVSLQSLSFSLQSWLSFSLTAGDVVPRLYMAAS